MQVSSVKGFKWGILILCLASIFVVIGLFNSTTSRPTTTPAQVGDVTSWIKKDIDTYYEPRAKGTIHSHDATLDHRDSISSSEHSKMISKDSTASIDRSKLPKSGSRSKSRDGKMKHGLDLLKFVNRKSEEVDDTADYYDPDGGSDYSALRDNDKGQPLILPDQTGKGFIHIPETNFYVYSAFLDVRLIKPRLFITAITMKPAPTFRCRLLLENGRQIEVPAEEEFITIFKDKPIYVHKQCYLECLTDKKLDRTTLLRVTHVGIRKVLGEVSSTTFLPVQQVGFNNNPPKLLGTCASAIFNLNDSHIVPFIEWVEYQLMFGSSKIHLQGAYNISDSMKQLIQYYEKRGVLKLEPWNIQPEVKVFYRAQKMSFNDCLYRYLDDYEFMAFIDTDEFILVKNVILPSTISPFETMIHNIKKFSPDFWDTTYSLTFNEIRFCEETGLYKMQTAKYLGYDRFQATDTMKLKTARFTAATQSSINRNPKTIAHLRDTGHMDVHRPNSPKLGSRKKGRIVPNDVALVHHYRQQMDCPKNVARNYQLAPYLPKLYSRVKDRYTEFLNIKVKFVNGAL